MAYTFHLAFCKYQGNLLLEYIGVTIESINFHGLVCVVSSVFMNVTVWHTHFILHFVNTKVTCKMKYRKKSWIYGNLLA